MASRRDHTTQARNEPERAAHRALLVVRGENVARRALPKQGTWTIGRSEECEIFVDEPSVSREHALLHIDDDVEIEDLGGVNGTRVGGVRLPARARTPLRPGQVVALDGALLLLEDRIHERRAARVTTHARFEVRLEDACIAGAPFVVARCRFDGEAPEALLLECAAVVGRVAETEYELLIFGDRDSEPAEALRSRFAASGATATIGVARFPADARTCEALLERASPGFDDETQRVVVHDPAMEDLHRFAARVARGTISVLLLGETGVGKEIFATAIHAASPRSSGPFVKLNCAAISESLFDSEMFGHERGAFTGAQGRSEGLLVAASGGTLFLDEVGELPLSLQAKLLRALEEQRVRPVGGRVEQSIDVRFLAATNRDLGEEVAEGRFREDLYHRLDGVSLYVPPLRERTSEVVALAKTFVERASRDLQLPPPLVTDEVVTLLTAYDWPGNIRELRNVMERAVLLARDDVIEPEHLPLDRFLASSREDIEERRRTVETLRACRGNQTKAAERLGISRRGLFKRLKRYGLKT